MLNDRQMMRYSRHLLLEKVGEKGQLALQSAKVLVIGVGGLGSPVALYLAAAGVGELHLADGDSVELSNLQRQIIFSEHDVDELKVDAAERRLQELNDDIEIRVHPQHIDVQNCVDLIADMDVVLDCTDNFKTRHMINAACREQEVPLVSGAAIRLEGQLAVFDFRQPESPCYGCLYPAGSKEPQLNCANSGVLGPVLGVIASLQALSALKLLMGLPVETAKIKLFDGLSGDWQTFGIAKSSACDCASG
ncbi:HesA/MoeB/ThiF family protein [Echinimonas agarilytica]|uniref:HesA/MoeB/ThiF family protein n=1 Tax=Echinimonas agarilytica TaxID=1215918 RepID=A0AA41WA47_9GAMM|nr:HesA/MoeB/ThiF family protein [Echinimonas agarilytica]